MVNRVLIIVFCLFLTACTTTDSSVNKEDKKNEIAKLNIRMGMAYLERKDIERSKQKFLLALDADSSIPESWYSMGYFLEVTGNAKQAQKYYLKAVELAPKRGDTLNNYGTYLCRTGSYQEAVQQFLLATEDPKYLDSAGAYENAGLCSLKIPDPKAAKMYFEKAQAENPTRPTSLIELAELNYKEGDLLAADHHLEQFLQLSPPTPQSLSLKRKLEV